MRLAAVFILVPLLVGFVGCTAEPSQMENGAAADVSGNHPPVIHSLSLVPNPVVRHGVVTAVVETKDADQDEVQLRFRWLVNDVPVLGESSPTFNPSFTSIVFTELRPNVTFTLDAYFPSGSILNSTTFERSAR